MNRSLAEALERALALARQAMASQAAIDHLMEAQAAVRIGCYGPAAFFVAQLQDTRSAWSGIDAVVLLDLFERLIDAAMAARQDIPLRRRDARAAVEQAACGVA